MDARAKFHNINMYNEVGFFKDSQDEYQCRCCIHMDCFKYNCAEYSATIFCCKTHLYFVLLGIKDG